MVDAPPGKPLFRHRAEQLDHSHALTSPARNHLSRRGPGHSAPRVASNPSTALQPARLRKPAENRPAPKELVKSRERRKGKADNSHSSGKSSSVNLVGREQGEESAPLRGPVRGLAASASLQLAVEVPLQSLPRVPRTPGQGGRASSERDLIGFCFALRINARCRQASEVTDQSATGEGRRHTTGMS